ncbi:TPA: hypothetical protein ACRNHZ_000688 [Pseudomonas aeruginosa]
MSIANSRNPDSLAPLVAQLGSKVRAVTAEEASQADLVEGWPGFAPNSPKCN